MERTIHKLEEIIFEHEFISKIKPNKNDLFYNIINQYDKEIEQSPIDEDNIKKIPNFLKEHFRKNNPDEYYRPIIEFLHHSYILEPIISVIINQISPLAQWKNRTLEELIKKGFQEFESILLVDIQNSPSKQEAKDENPSIASVYSPKELAEDVIKKVIYLLEMEISLLLAELDKSTNKNKQEYEPENKYKDYESVILFCFILRKYLNRFPKSNTNQRTNIFDKQEVFEIEISENDTSSDNKNKELWSALEVSIPVVNSDFIQKITQKNPEKKPYSLLPGVVDLSFWCSPVRDQGSLNSCTAFAAISLFEYFVNKNFNKNVDASPLFLYKAARNKMNVTEDVGASIRETMKALALYGVPPEDSWSYDEKKVNEEPPAYCYAYAQNYQSLKYFHLDYAGIPKETLLFQIKAVLAAGFPCIFGFTLYSSVYEDSNEPGHIPFPNAESDKVAGGHTVVAVGYDDFKFIQSADHKKYSKGAFLIRNSWGTDWGIEGYGWLPYDYVLAGLTAAWWSLIKSEWFNEGNFGALGGGGGNNGGND